MTGHQRTQYTPSSISSRCIIVLVVCATAVTCPVLDILSTHENHGEHSELLVHQYHLQSFIQRVGVPWDLPPPSKNLPPPEFFQNPPHSISRQLSSIIFQGECPQTPLKVMLCTLPDSCTFAYYPYSVSPPAKKILYQTLIYLYTLPSSLLISLSCQMIPPGSCLFSLMM